MTISSSNGIEFSISNPDIGGKAVVYTGKSATLELQLTNHTGAAIPLKDGDVAPTLTVYPARFYTSDQVKDMSVTAEDWTATLSGRGWGLTYTGEAKEWAANGTLVIQIAKAVSTAQPSSGFIQIVPKNLGPSAPVSLSANLSLNHPPEPGNADLTKALSLLLNNGGVVYVSTKDDPLPNTLFLNLKNIGDKPIYEGPKDQMGKPEVRVSFVYGSTAGALATNDDPNAHPDGSAWKIEAGVAVGKDWQALNPTYSDEQRNPVWVLKPTETNLDILGTGADANVTFSFGNIVSLTPPGNTQMMVQCTGFKQTATRLYNDFTFVIDISKRVAPPTRGLLNFFGDQPVFTVHDPTATNELTLRWTMFDVPSVLLMASIPQFQPRKIEYPKFTPIAYDELKVTIPGVRESTLILFTLQAFDGAGNFLNTLQYASFVQAYMFVDPRDGQVYNAMLVGKTLWMAHNLNYKAEGSRYYNNDAMMAKQYGRLYSWEEAAAAPPGWRLPGDEDWEALIKAYGTAKEAYEALIAGGSSGFEAQLGGYADNHENFDGLDSLGNYWSATPAVSREGKAEGGSHNYAQFALNQGSGSVTTGANYPDDFLVSVRYVRDIE